MPATKYPTRSDFPSNLVLTLHPSAPPHDPSSYHPHAAIGPALPSTIPRGTPPPTPPTNILILLHGLGNSHIPYAALSAQLNLSDTLCIAIRAPSRLPFAEPVDVEVEEKSEGWHWGDDVVWDGGSQGIDMDGGFDGAVELVGEKVVNEVLVRRCGYDVRRIVVWGMGQGGCVGLSLAAAVNRLGKDGDGNGGERNGKGASPSCTNRLGGVISFGGTLPAAVSQKHNSPTSSSSISSTKTQKLQTPLLLIGGSSATAITEAEVNRVKNIFNDVTVHKWRMRSGDGMPKNKEEMEPVMRFLARVLKMGVPNGMVEVGFG